MADEKKLTQGFEIRDKVCAVIGLGGLGTNVAVHLAGAGVGKMYLCDFDTVNKNNLNRQFFYTDGDIGKKKCIALKKRLSEYAPECEYTVSDKKINNISDLKYLRECDIIFSCVDNNEVRLVIESFCRENNISLVHGGIDGFYGTAYLYVPSFSPSPSQAGLCEGDKARHNISAVAGVIGSMQASLGIKYLLDGGSEHAGKILIFDGAKTDTLNLKF